MKGGPREDGDTAATSFNLEVELSSLVAAKVIPQVVAEKLEKKLKEKNVQLTKEQLYKLAEKIHALLNSYSNKPYDASSSDSNKSEMNNDEQVSDPGTFESSSDMQGILEKIEEMQDQIKALKDEKLTQNIEKDQGTDDERDMKDSKTTFVTTDDITLPDHHNISVDSLSNNPLKLLPNDPKSIIVLMNWLQYLIDRCGHDNLSDILDYYVDVDWITDDVKISLIDYSNGITSESNSSSKASDKKVTNLPSKDHIQSFLFIQKLKGKEFDKHFVDRINGELTRLMKKVEIYEKIK